MLSAADADLVRRDPALPGLATLLDPEAFAAALAPYLPDAEPVTAHGVYLRYKPGTNCLVSYRLETRGAWTTVYAKAHGPDAAVKLAKARAKPGVPGAFWAGRVVLDGAGIVASFFPNDAKLKSLARLADPGSRREVLRELLPDAPDLQEGGIQALRYKPERRYVARVTAGGESRAVLKAYTPADYRAAEANARAFAPGGALRLARRLGGSARHGIVAFEWRPGFSLAGALPDAGGGPGAVRTAGAALAGLHAQEGRGLSRVGRKEEVETLGRISRELGFTCPDLAGLAGKLCGWLARRLSLEAGRNVPIHGDFYEDQVLIRGETATILDLDRAMLGDPAADLGLFVAHLESDALRGELPQDRVGALSRALLEGYRDAGGRVEEPRVELYAACGLLKLAPEPFRHRDPAWPESTRGVLERACEVSRAPRAAPIR